MSESSVTFDVNLEPLAFYHVHLFDDETGYNGPKATKDILLI